MLPIHVFYAIDLVRERHREEASRNAIRRERQAAGHVAPSRPVSPGFVRRTIGRGATAVSSSAGAVARSVYEQAVDRAGTSS